MWLVIDIVIFILIMYNIPMIHPIIPPINGQEIPTLFVIIFAINWLSVKKLLIIADKGIAIRSIAIPPIIPSYVYDIVIIKFLTICFIKL